MAEYRTRADAVRNRGAVLHAAAQLYAAARPGDHVSIDAVAGAAGVGKGTVFRAFEDRAGLLRALMVHQGAGLRDRIEHGPAPLGVGTPAAERLPAVLSALLELKLANRALALDLERLGAASPYAGGTYRWWHELVAGLVQELEGPRSRTPRPSFTADALLAAVRSDLIEHQVSSEGRSPTELGEDLTSLVERLVRSFGGAAG